MSQESKQQDWDRKGEEVAPAGRDLYAAPQREWKDEDAPPRRFCRESWTVPEGVKER